MLASLKFKVDTRDIGHGPRECFYMDVLNINGKSLADIQIFQIPAWKILQSSFLTHKTFFFFWNGGFGLGGRDAGSKVSEKSLML